MITKNYYRYLAYLFSKSSAIKVKNYSGDDKTVVYTASSILTWGYDENVSYYACMKALRTSFDGHGGVILGDGDTSPTFDDYKLAGNIISSYTYSSTLKQVASDTAVTTKAVYTITNTGSVEITIKEIGLIGFTNTNTTAASATLFDRTVLDTPVTIPAGGVGQVEYTITFTLPTAAADAEETETN